MKLKRQSSNSNCNGTSDGNLPPLDVADVPDVLLETIHFLRKLQADAGLPEAIRAEAGKFIARQRQCVASIAAAAEQLVEVA